MADASTDLTALYTPPTIPGSLGGVTQQPQSTGSVFSETNAAMMQGLSGVGEQQPSLPIGSGVPMFAAEDIANVGGVTSAAPVEDTKTFIPELPDPLEEQTSMFTDAYSKGYTTTEDTRGKADSSVAAGAATGAAIGSVVPGLGTLVGAGIGATIGLFAGHKEGKTAEAGTMQAARLAKRDDRASDKEVRREAKKDMQARLEASGMKKGKARRQSRKMKRRIRGSQKAERKEAWKTFKGERDLQAQDDAYRYEQQYG